MIKLVDLSFYVADEFNNPLEVIQAQKPALGYIDHIKQRVQIQAVKHLHRDTRVTVEGVTYTFFEGRNGFWHMPFKALNYLAAENPDIVIVQGLAFPLQVILLRLWLGSKTVLVAQHHAERPMKGFAKLFQQLADRFIKAYLFTARENAQEWFNHRIIRNRAKYFELLELSTWFTRQPKREARIKTGMGDGDIFLWVGRLEANKDPLTVLHGFAKYLAVNPGAKLYMAYQEENLLAEVTSIICKNALLKKSVYLLGKVEHRELPALFSAADFYLSGSHREGSGTALIESMACGCIPVVTYIPSFRKITNEGRYGFLYKPGDAQSLFDTLCILPDTGREQFSAEIVRYFNTNLSYRAIADELFNICSNLIKQAPGGAFKLQAGLQP